MKRLALFAAVVLAVAACSKGEEKPADTTPAAMAPAPAPAMSDSMKMKDSIRADSIRKDSIAKAGMKNTKSTKTTKPATKGAKKP